MGQENACYHLLLYSDIFGTHIQKNSGKSMKMNGQEIRKEAWAGDLPISDHFAQIPYKLHV
jgi:hypothetical protein